MANDNTTGQSAATYDREVQTVIPYRAEILATAIEVALTARPSPARWLDTGAGPGHLVENALRQAPSTEFWLADPSAAMLEIARQRLPAVAPERFLQIPTQRLEGGARFDVVTAILCHHYGDRAAREAGLARCREALVEGGALITFENVLAETEPGHALQRARWGAFQLRQGRDPQAVREQLAREGRQFFPIRVSEHRTALERAGFRVVELVWRAYAQAGFLAIK